MAFDPTSGSHSFDSNAQAGDTPFRLPQDTYRKIAPIDRVRWNRVYPYSFALYRANDDGSVIASSLLEKDSNFDLTRVTLNIPPSSIKWSLPFASQLTATNDGVLEEMNGLVLRPITISGTTGFMPNRDQTQANSSLLSGVQNIASSLFPSTVGALASLVNSAKSTGASIVGGGKAQRNPLFDPSNASNILAHSGYYNFWLLQNFLIAYNENKKLPQNKNLRLVFEVPKDNIGYVVTVHNMDAGKSAANPYLMEYQISMTAWDVLTLSQTSNLNIPNIPSPRNPGAIRSALNVLRNTRNTLLQAQNTLHAANADIVDVLNVYQQAYLSYKTIAGAKQDITDFGNAVRANAASLLNRPDFANRLNSVWKDQRDSGNADAHAVLGGGAGSPDTAIDTSTPSNTPALTTPGGQTVEANTNPAPPQGQRLSTALSKALDNPEIGENISITDFSLPPALSQAIQKANREAQNLSAADIRNTAARLRETIDALAFQTGSMDPDYQKAYGLITPNGSTRDLTIDDIILQDQILQGEDALVGSLATGELYQEKGPDPFVSANEALDPTAQLPSPLSAYPVVMVRGETLEKMAQQYLGDANRSLEIAILNDLRAPYIDETGFTISLGSVTGRTGIVTSATNLAAGQRVRISGTGVPSCYRNILNIEKFDDQTFRVTFDGDATLGATYTAGTSPQLWSRLPGTIGSGDTVLIPSPVGLDELPERPTSLSKSLSHAEKIFKTDIALDESGDLALDPSGDFALVSGYQNAIQALKIKCETELKELEQHPTFGIPVTLGGRNSDIPGGNIQEIIQKYVTSDPRFRSASVSVSVQGSVTNITIVAQGAANSGLIPVTFSIGSAA